MGKGSNTTTTNQTQSYTPTGGPQIQAALTQAQNAAQLPFNIPQAPVAGFSQDQQTAFGNINAAQGMAQPYINQAQQYFSPQGAQSFANPYIDAVTAQMQNIFGQQNSQNTGQLTQAAGGVGADRIAVGQGNLANQQALAAGQTYSGIYNNAVQQAQSAGYGTAALGSQAQNAALQGAQAQLASGGLQQQLQQAQLNSPYQQQLAQAAFPYQQAQFLAGITGSLAPGLGGTTTGQGTTTSPSPSLFSQILGLGTAGVGAAGGLGAFGGGSKGSGAASQAQSANTLANNTGGAFYGPGFTRGGSIGYAEGGETESSPFDLPPNFNDKPINVAEKSIIPAVQTPAIQPHIPQLNLNPPQQSGGGGGGPGIGDIAKLAMMFVNRGGRVNPYAEGGSVKDQSRYGDDPTALIAPDKVNQFEAHFLLGPPRTANTPGYNSETSSKRQPNPGPSRRKSLEGYADGGAPMEEADWPVGPIGGPSDVVNFGDPIRSPDEAAVNQWRREVDADIGRPGNDAMSATPVAFKPAFPPPSGAHGRSVGAPAAEQPADTPQDLSGRSQSPVAPQESTPAGKSGRFIDSPWAALMAAGLGIAGGTSPFAGVNIGQGALQGLKTLETQKTSGQKDETIAQATRRLDLEAKHHEDQFTRMTPYQQETLNRPIKIGSDVLGHDILAVRDKETGAYVDPITHKPIPDPNARAPAYNIPPGGGKEDEAALPPHARLTEGVTIPEGVDRSVLARVPPDVANTVRAIDEGRANIASIPMKDRQAYIKLVNEYDPAWNQNLYSLRKRQNDDLSSNGNAGKMILAVNQLLPHLKTASDKAQALENSNFQGGNAVTNWLRTQTGDPRPGNFETVREVAAMDAARLLRGSGQMAEKDIEFWRNNLGTAGSPRQLQEKIQLLADDLMGARISSIQHSYRTNMRMEPPDFISKEAKQALETIKGRQGGGQQPTAAAPAAAASAAPAAAAPQVGEVRTNAHGKKGRWNGTGWETVE